jgi:hypothetical protein
VLSKEQGREHPHEQKWPLSFGTDSNRILTWKGMLGAFSPQPFDHRERINLMFVPPLPLIARGMVLLMVNGT